MDVVTRGIDFDSGQRDLTQISVKSGLDRARVDVELARGVGMAWVRRALCVMVPRGEIVAICWVGVGVSRWVASGGYTMLRG